MGLSQRKRLMAVIMGKRTKRRRIKRLQSGIQLFFRGRNPYLFVSCPDVGYLGKRRVVGKANVGYWERALASWREEDYKKHLRLSKGTFHVVVEMLRNDISKEQTRLQQPVSPECRVAVALCRLGSDMDYRSIGEHFGLGKSTVFMITKEVCCSLVRRVMPKTVRMPDNIATTALAFCVEKGLPNCVGAIDGCHINIPKPVQNGPDYFNRKGSYSINMQALTDSQGLFLDVVIGWPGKAHDSRIFCNSPLYIKAEGRGLFPSSQMIVLGASIPYYIVADSTYPLRPWVMKVYANPSSPAEEYFNKKLCIARRVVEQAFGRLKHRWRCLLKRCDASPEYACLQIASCVTLHNICERRADLIDEVAIDEEINSIDGEMMEDPLLAQDGANVRDALKSFLSRSA